MILQNDIGNRNASTTIVAPATGTHRGYPFEVLVEEDESPFERDSAVRLGQIRVVSIEKRIYSVVGSLSEPTMAEVDEALKPSLGLDRVTDFRQLSPLRTFSRMLSEMFLSTVG